jgi:short-subunit dehydrogenase
MDLTRLALPPMLARGQGHIVNIASVAGLAPVPYASVYAATKHAIVGFSQSLRFEVLDDGVGVSVVCPGFVRDAGLFHDNTGGQTSTQQTVSPQEVADAVVKAITGNKDRVIVSPAMMKLAPLVTGISPTLPARVAKMNGSYAAMRGVAERLKAEESAADRAKSAAKPRRARAPKKTAGED